jgi:hypothetical protein
MIRPALFSLLLATPAFADDGALRMIAEGTGVPPRGIERAYAACVLSAGQIDPVIEVLADLNLARNDDTEMGVTTLSAPDLPFAITFYDKGAICDVSSESIGTTEARIPLSIVAGMTGFQMDSAAECFTAIMGTVRAQLTSSGNDPVCEDANTSNVRFTLETN